MDKAPPWPMSEVLTRRPGWPVEPPVPAARQAADAVAPPVAEAPVWPPERAETGELAAVWPTAAPDRTWPPAGTQEPRAVEPVTTPGVHRRPDAAREPGPAWPTATPNRHERPDIPPPSFLKRPIVGVPALESRQGVVPVAFGGRHAAANGDEAIVHTLCETTATGLRKFDLGNVPASVTPPRSWRRAAWFAVGTSAAVVLGLTVAAAELMGRPVSDSTFIDAMPAYPTGPLTLDRLPNEETTTDRSRPTSTTRNTPSRTLSDESQPVTEPVEAPRDTVGGDTSDEGTTGPSSQDGPPSQDTTTTTSYEPTRRTVGPAPVTPTDPAAMGDRTERYFKLVTTDAAAAHAMTTGGMAREGAEGIEARYVGVRRVEVQDITIDRNQAITTSTIKVVHEDGTETIEHRQLTFTWGGDPKITEDSTTE